MRHNVRKNNQLYITEERDCPPSVVVDYHLRIVFVRPAPD